METEPVSAATGATGSVLKKLGALLADEHAIPNGDVESLKAELQAVHSFLKTLSQAEDPGERGRRWMKEAREFSYDVEDALDELMLPPRDGSGNSNPDGFSEKISTWLTEAAARRRTGQEISDSISRAGTGGVEAEDPRRDCSLYKETGEPVGLDGPADELIKMLNGGGQQLGVVSIVGCGGLGKTTLARRVYNTFGEQFEYRAFVSVSRKPHLVAILRDIRSQLGYEYDQTLTEDAQSFADSVSNFLQDKRYFIVVDDVWDVQTWDIIKGAFPKSNFGSRIITTTRIHEVAKSCSATCGGRAYTLSPLITADSERLFYKIVFNSGEQCPSHLKRVSDKILQKCGGLPLAIIAISGLLIAKNHEDQWEQVYTSIWHGLGSNPAVERTMRILLLGYFDLSPCLKSCLLYLSVFPEGYAIKKERLVMRWIAEGFIPEEHGHTLYESGERCFNELINRNLIQPGEMNKFGEVESCRVHGIILDFLVSMSNQDNFVTFIGVPGVIPEPQNKVRRLSLQGDNEIPADLILCNARSLSVFGGCVKMPSLSKFRHLRILDMEGSGEVEDQHLAEIGGLFHLKYLRLKSKVGKLPQQIAELQYLESLEICESNATTEIPSAINQLTRLVRLVVNDETILPDEIGGIKALQVLRGINVNTQSTNFVRQVCLLSNLRELSISFINYYAGDNWKENQEEMVSSICRLGRANLHVLHITINEGADEIFEESWSPAPLSLRELVVEVGVVSSVPRWIGSLVNLQKLAVPMWEVGEEDVVILGSLPDLRHLSLTALAAGSKEGRLRVTQSHGFPSLINFQIGGEECALGISPASQAQRFALLTTIPFVPRWRLPWRDASTTIPTVPR
ncbi:disease resistance protein RGA5 isoform X2 [Triticum aestivum]|uniref:disease resistance protein RGA5 isoform X2 n=1 Tax=Triticum aestivum TaxID=4565 RepID=UPI000844DBFC|nr:disease resistance protein RGA5-like isoform X2 [Triticum aestivum]